MTSNFIVLLSGGLKSTALLYNLMKDHMKEGRRMLNVTGLTVNTGKADVAAATAVADSLNIQNLILSNSFPGSKPLLQTTLTSMLIEYARQLNAFAVMAEEDAVVSPYEAILYLPVAKNPLVDLIHHGVDLSTTWSCDQPIYNDAYTRTVYESEPAGGRNARLFIQATPSEASAGSVRRALWFKEAGIEDPLKSIWVPKL